MDVVSISRFQQALIRTPELVCRLFQNAEGSLPVASLAARFAAKEAFVKAIGRPIQLGWLDVWVQTNEFGAPEFGFSPTAITELAQLGIKKSWLSLAHDGDIATAFVVLQ